MKSKLTIFCGLLLIAHLSICQQLIKDSSSKLNYIESKSQNSSNTIIMIHGYGSDEKDLFGFRTYFPNSDFYCVQGPITLGVNSFSWYKITFNKDGSKERDLIQAQSSLKQLAEFIATVKNNTTNKIIIGGFSQGAILSLQLAIEYPKLMNGVICFSGMPWSETGTTSKTIDHAKIKAFYGHGVQDNVLPISEGRKCKNIITESGMNMTYKEYAMNHQIIEQEIKDVIEWYRSNFLTAK